MQIAACRCDDENGCYDCGRTGSQRRCDTCGDYFPCERVPIREDFEKPWSCAGCWRTCHECGRAVSYDAIRWLDEQPRLGRTAMHVRLCARCKDTLEQDGMLHSYEQLGGK